MREIKFRAWDGKKMHYDAMKATRMSEQTVHGLTLPAYWAPQFAQVSMNDLMQYTGLKDKNGVEIYDSDICRVWCEGYKYESETVCLVKWGGEYPAFELYVCGKLSEPFCEEWNSFSDPSTIIEVIGNIYENPELLEANNE